VEVRRPEKKGRSKRSREGSGWGDRRRKKLPNTPIVVPHGGLKKKKVRVGKRDSTPKTLFELKKDPQKRICGGKRNSNPSHRFATNLFTLWGGGLSGGQVSRWQALAGVQEKRMVFVKIARQKKKTVHRFGHKWDVHVLGVGGT